MKLLQQMFLDDIIAARDRDEVSILVLLDFSKAFDLIDHQILLSILHYIGFGDEACIMMKSFLGNRVQQVIYEEESSDWMDLLAGVVQGSILGPILYTIYTSRSPYSLSRCRYHSYADDTQIYYSFPEDDIVSATEVLNGELESFCRWAADHSLILNPEKSTVLIFGSDSQIRKVKNTATVRLNGISLPFSDTGRSLGLILDSKLRFREYVTSKLRAAYGGLKSIYSHRHYLPEKSKKMLLEALVLSHFNFCCSVYVPCLDSHCLYRIQKVQNSCLRLLYGVKRREHITPYLNRSGWLNMANRAKFLMRCFYFKILKFRTPPYLYNRIRFRTDVHTLNLRRRVRLTIPKHRKEIFKRSFSYNIVDHINALNRLDLNRSLSSFKKEIKSAMLLEQGRSV